MYQREPVNLSNDHWNVTDTTSVSSVKFLGHIIGDPQIVELPFSLTVKHNLDGTNQLFVIILILI